jgi:hypothetical protein
MNIKIIDTKTGKRVAVAEAYLTAIDENLWPKYLNVLECNGLNNVSLSIEASDDGHCRFYFKGYSQVRRMLLWVAIPDRFTFEASAGSLTPADITAKWNEVAAPVDDTIETWRESEPNALASWQRVRAALETEGAPYIPVAIGSECDSEYGDYTLTLYFSKPGVMITINQFGDLYLCPGRSGFYERETLEEIVTRLKTLLNGEAKCN